MHVLLYNTKYITSVWMLLHTDYLSMSCSHCWFSEFLQQKKTNKQKKNCGNIGSCNETCGEQIYTRFLNNEKYQVCSEYLFFIWKRWPVCMHYNYHADADIEQCMALLDNKATYMYANVVVECMPYLHRELQCTTWQVNLHWPTRDILKAYSHIHLTFLCKPNQSSNLYNCLKFDRRGITSKVYWMMFLVSVHGFQA